jgi:hypothetical protein
MKTQISANAEHHDDDGILREIEMRAIWLHEPATRDHPGESVCEDHKFWIDGDPEPHDCDYVNAHFDWNVVASMETEGIANAQGER